MYDKITEIFRRDAEWRWRRSLPLILRDMVSVYGGFYGDKWFFFNLVEKYMLQY